MRATGVRPRWPRPRWPLAPAPSVSVLYPRIPVRIQRRVPGIADCRSVAVFIHQTGGLVRNQISHAAPENSGKNAGQSVYGSRSRSHQRRIPHALEVGIVCLDHSQAGHRVQAIGDDNQPEGRCLHSLCRLANIIFTIFDQFRNWRNALNSILLTTESFHDIFMASRELLHMEFLLFNSRYEVLAVSDAFFGHFQEDLRQAAGSFVRELEADEEHILADHFADKQIYELPSDSSTHRMYAYNIFFHDAHSATLIAVCPQKEHEEGDIQFLYYTGAMIADFYAGYYSRIDRSNAESRLVGLLHAFSRGDLSGADQASDILYSFGWLTYHTYLAIEFTFLQSLEQIEKITKIDLQNMRERTFLQLSFILDEENR